MAKKSNDIWATVCNIEYFHECSKTASECFTSHDDIPSPVLDHHHNEGNKSNVDDNEEDAMLNENTAECCITEEQVINALDTPFNVHELFFAEVAINIAVDKNTFDDIVYDLTYQWPTHPALAQDLVQFDSWENAIALATHVQDDSTVTPTHFHNGSEQAWSIGHDMPILEPTVQVISSEDSPNVNCSKGPILNTWQTMVHNIVKAHLEQHLKGGNPAQ